MENWIIFTKLTIMFYIAFNVVRIHFESFLSWIVFLLVLYFCINIMIYIFKRALVRRMMMILSLVITIIGYSLVNPLFLLLLPLSLLELMFIYTRKKLVLLAVVIIPVLYIVESLQPSYLLISILSFVIFIVLTTYSERLHASEEQLDRMRKDLQRLTKSLSDNHNFMRQLEYTYKLEERNRLSQEIHDKIGHAITGALFQMEAAKRLVGTDEMKAQELLQNAINISKDGIESIRITLKNLKPPTEQIGIHHMKLFMDDFSAKHAIKTYFHYEGNLDLITSIQWKIIQENVTEALTNTLKYADASEVAVAIHVLNKMIKVEVRDNGKGILNIKKGLGIIGMEERAASLNGKIIVDGSNGFSVTTLLPINFS